MSGDPLVYEWRCAHCGGLLARVGIVRGRIQIKCGRCNTLADRVFQ